MMAEPAELFLRELGDLLTECRRKYEDGGFEADFYESSKRRLEYLVSVLEYILELAKSVALNNLLAGVRPWVDWLDAQPVSRSICCTTPASILAEVHRSGGQGRPAYDISKENLEFLRDSGFKWTQIAKMFRVSESTITRRVREFGIQTSLTVATLSDGDLRHVIAEIHSSHVDAGCRMVRGILMGRGLRVSLQRVHETLSALDPILAANRWGAVVQRRTYSVKGANSLWHIDSHHSLIRWRFIIHGGR